MFTDSASALPLDTAEEILQLLQHPRACHERMDHLLAWLDHNWFEFVVYCSDRMICSNLPALLSPLGETLSVPIEMREMLEAVSDANRERNASLLREYGLIKEVLHSVGINPIPLKGIAILEQGIYPDDAQRMVGDIDLAIAPDALPTAIRTLRLENYTQVANRYISNNLETGVSFLPIDETDFRNSIEFVECHIPRIVRPGQINTIEVHVHVTNRTSVLSPWLDKYISENDPLFHLIHNFEHSHRKDSWALLGLLDWRHLMDAANRIQRDGSGQLPKDMMQLAIDHKLDDEMAVHLYQLERYLGVPDLSELFSLSRHKHAIAVFERCHRQILRQRVARLGYKLRQGVNGVFSPAALRERYGPRPLSEAMRMSAGFYWSRILRGDLNRDI